MAAGKNESEVNEQMRVVLGGTFSPLHDGHRALLRYATSQATELIIGVTVNSMVQDKKHPIAPFAERVAGVMDFVRSLAPDLSVTIAPLHDTYGHTVSEDYDLLVVSPETMTGALRINFKRREAGKPPLRIAEIGWVLAEDGYPISSTRIWAGEIDEYGRFVR